MLKMGLDQISSEATQVISAREWDNFPKLIVFCK